MTDTLDMLSERYLERYADVLLWGLKTARQGRFRKGNVILIQYDRAALRLAEILYEKIIAAGMNPLQRMGLTVGMERSFFGKSGGRQLVFQPPGEKELCGNLHGRIYLHAPDSLTHLKEVDPARIGKVLVARKPLRDILELFALRFRCGAPNRNGARGTAGILNERQLGANRCCGSVDFHDENGSGPRRRHRPTCVLRQRLQRMRIDDLHGGRHHTPLDESGHGIHVVRNIGELGQ